MCIMGDVGNFVNLIPALKHEEIEICPDRVAGNFFILIA